MVLGVVEKTVMVAFVIVVVVAAAAAVSAVVAQEVVAVSIPSCVEFRAPLWTVEKWVVIGWS